MGWILIMFRRRLHAFRLEIKGSPLQAFTPLSTVSAQIGDDRRANLIGLRRLCRSARHFVDATLFPASHSLDFRRHPM